MSARKWTKEKPTRAGWYFWTYRADRRTPDRCGVIRLGVVDGGRSQLYVQSTAGLLGLYRSSRALESHGWWSLIESTEEQDDAK